MDINDARNDEFPAFSRQAEGLRSEAYEEMSNALAAAYMLDVSAAETVLGNLQIIDDEKTAKDDNQLWTGIGTIFYGPLVGTVIGKQIGDKAENEQPSTLSKSRISSSRSRLF